MSNLASPPPPAPADPVPDLYRALHSASLDAMENLVGTASSRKQLIEIHAFIQDLDPWLSVLDARLELDPLKTAMREFHAAVLMATQALYRPAYMALRLFLELSLGTIYFSTLDFELRRWAAGERDVIWSEITHKSQGLLSPAFARVYAPPLKDTQSHFYEIAIRTYRECSQFVHGNPEPTSLLPTDIIFSESTFSSFFDSARSAARTVLYALILRYFSDLDDIQVEKIKPVVVDQFGDISAIRAFTSPVPE